MPATLPIHVERSPVLDSVELVTIGVGVALIVMTLVRVDDPARIYSIIGITD